MINIEKVKEILPIQINQYKLSILSLKYMDKYIDNCVKYYYNQYDDFDFAKDISRDKLEAYIYKLINSYLFNMAIDGECRLILVNNNTLIAGCTIFERKKDLEIGWWVIPEYQHKNIGYMMMSKIIDELYTSSITFKNLYCVIREDNQPSIKLAQRLGFEMDKVVKGRTKNNYILKHNYKRRT